MSAAFQQPQPEHSFMQAVISMGDLIFSAKSLAQVKVEYFIFLNTIRYQEYETTKKITLDEFLHGRKRKDGTRLSSGCGLASKSSIVKGINDGRGQGHIIEDRDDKDAARILKRYGLSLPTRQEYTVCTSDNITPINSRASGTQSVPLEYTPSTSEVHSLYLDQSKYLGEVPIVSTSTACEADTQPLAIVAPTARTSDDAQGKETYSAVRKGEESETEDLQRKIATLQAELAQERNHKKQIDLRIRIRVIQRRLEELLTSHSHAPEAQVISPELEAQARAWLSEQLPQAIGKYGKGAEIEKPAQEPAALFPEAIPPEKVSLEKEVGAWFYDMAHIDERNRQKLNIALGRLRKAGYTSLDDIRAAYERWRFGRAATLKRAGVMDFANNACVGGA